MDFKVIHVSAVTNGKLRQVKRNKNRDRFAVAVKCRLLSLRLIHSKVVWNFIPISNIESDEPFLHCISSLLD